LLPFDGDDSASVLFQKTSKHSKAVSDMSNPNIASSPYAAAALLGRLLMGAIFVWSGMGKLLAATATIGYFGKLGLPMPPVAFTVAVLVEVGIGILFVVGFFTRSTALILAFWSIATALVAHTNFADRNMLIHFYKNVSICGGFISVALLGPGAFSIDALIWPRSIGKS
jgi:putative oxidoreductase